MSTNTNWRWVLFYLLIVYARSSSQASTPASKSYIAAVVEFAPEKMANNSKLTLQINTLRYLKLIQDAGKQNADIVVFPENGITGYEFPERSELDSWTTLIPSADAEYTPCTTNMNGVSEVLKNISCAARNNKIYTVINIAEKEHCTGNNCPEDKVFYYNTNVVFDRSGTIIAKYRKVNLFVEPGFDSPARPDVVTFDTDFGVKFGTFICFDILFANPSLILTRNRVVTDIIFTTAWFSETPFLTSIQTQSGWAFSENVNFLAAGYNNPIRGTTGSGIYFGRNGISKAIILTNRGTKLLVGEVPKMPSRILSHQNVIGKEHPEIAYAKSKVSEHFHNELRRKREVMEDSMILLRENVTSYQTEILKGDVTKTLCHNNHCCRFVIETIKLDKKVQYRLVVFNGIRVIANIRSMGVRLCSVIQCSDNTLQSCGSVIESATTFNKISISGKFDKSKYSLIMPNTLGQTLLPLHDWSFKEYAFGDHKHVYMSSNGTLTNPITFGIYSRDNSRDNTVN
ncbi:vanin-like protein 1 [Vespa velutina]|uniref:vanin-like protein 1 n=1 Tax=Vespa velutina TaxID=202808 RepID=UPI001FB21513|nr:vanin-like protein 1 [Vespa velutina]